MTRLFAEWPGDGISYNFALKPDMQPLPFNCLDTNCRSFNYKFLNSCPSPWLPYTTDSFHKCILHLLRDMQVNITLPEHLQSPSSEIPHSTHWFPHSYSLLQSSSSPLTVSLTTLKWVQVLHIHTEQLIYNNMSLFAWVKAFPFLLEHD